MSLGVNSTQRYYEFQLDSYDANYSGDGTSATTDWPLFKIGGKRPLTNVAGIKILEAQIPFTWYTMNTSNNTFVLQYGSTPTTVTLTPGNYNSTTLSTELQTALNNAAVSIGRSDTWNVTYNSVTQKFLIVNSITSSALGFSFTFSTGSDSPRNLIGFAPGTTFSTTTGTYSNFITSTNAIQLTGPNYLYVNSLKLGTLIDMYLPAGSSAGGGNSGPQIAKIPVNVNPGGVINWADPDPTKYFDLENLAALTEIDFYLTLGNTTNQTPLQLNGAGFSLKIGLLETDLTLSRIGYGTSKDDRVIKRMRPA